MLLTVDLHPQQHPSKILQLGPHSTLKKKKKQRVGLQDGSVYFSVAVRGRLKDLVVWGMLWRGVTAQRQNVTHLDRRRGEINCTFTAGRQLLLSIYVCCS